MPSPILRAAFLLLFSLSAFAGKAIQKAPLKIVIDQTTTREDLQSFQKDVEKLGYYLDIRQVKFNGENKVEAISGHFIAGYQCLSFDMKEMQGKVVIRQNEWGDIMVHVGKS